MYLYFGTFLLTFLMYKYKYYILYRIFLLCSFCINVYYYFNKNKDDSLKVSTTYKLKNIQIVNYIMFYKNNKKNNIKIIYNNSDILHNNYVVLQDILKNDNYKNRIVHCSLTNEISNDMIDLTHLFREFIYHFDKDDNKSLIINLLEYVKESYGLNTLEDYVFIVYMNDDNFTEVKYTLDQIGDLKFKDVLQIEVD